MCKAPEVGDMICKCVGSITPVLLRVETQEDNYGVFSVVVIPDPKKSATTPKPMRTYLRRQENVESMSLIRASNQWCYAPDVPTANVEFARVIESLRV